MMLKSNPVDSQATRAAPAEQRERSVFVDPEEARVSRIARYRAEAARCLAATCDETLSRSERFGAQMGELDWVSAEAMEQE